METLKVNDDLVAKLEAMGFIPKNGRCGCDYTYL